MSMEKHEKCGEKIRVRHYMDGRNVPEGFAPHSMYIYYCKKCEVPIAAQMILYPKDTKFPTVKDLPKVMAGKMKAPKADIQDLENSETVTESLT